MSGLLKEKEVKTELKIIIDYLINPIYLFLGITGLLVKPAAAPKWAAIFFIIAGALGIVNLIFEIKNKRDIKRRKNAEDRMSEDTEISQWWQGSDKYHHDKEEK